MIESPLVNISIPVYNGEKYIEKTILSVLNQTYKNIKLVISDNNSSDNTEEICNIYKNKDSRVTYYRINQKLSINDSFDRAFDVADSKANYFMWLGSDDILDINCIDILLKNQKNNLIVGPRINHIDGSDKAIRYIGNNIPLFFLSKYAVSRKIKYYLTPDFLGKANLFLSLWSMEMLKDYKVMLEPRGQYSDSLMIWNFLGKYSAVMVEGAILYKRIHSLSTSSTEQKLNFNNTFEHYFKGVIINLGLDSFYSTFKSSNIFYKFLLILFLPLKTLVALFVLKKFQKFNE